MPKRRRLGPVYELSPAQLVREWFIENIGKVMFTVVGWLIWIGVFYVILGVVNFLAVNMAIWEETRNVDEMMQGETSKLVIFIGMVVLTIYIFRDPMKKQRKKR